MDKNIIEPSPKKNWPYIFSPCVIAVILFVVASIYYVITMGSGEKDAWGVFAIILLLPYLLALLILDIIIRAFLKGVKNKEVYIWVIEPFLIAFVLLVCHAAHSRY